MQAVIAVQNLVQKIGRKLVLNDVSFTVEKGECFGVFGTRGKGKTTLLHILAGIDRFKSGSVLVAGVNVQKNESFKKKLGLVTQQPSLFPDLSTVENLDFIATIKEADKTKIARLVQDFELEDYLKQPVTMLDAGVYQRLSLACALLNEPEILIIDELINDVDMYSRKILIREVKKFLAAGSTVVWGFSNPDYLHHMDKVAWLNDGKLTVISPEQAREKWARGEADV